jgi:6-phosphogluconolactonase
MAWELHKYSNNATLVQQLAKEIAKKLNAAIELRGHATLAVSGGSTPKPLFEELAQSILPWSSVTVTLVDERWVDESHSDSNAKLVKEFLMQHEASDAHFVALTNEAKTPFDAEAAINERLAELPMPIDVVILGMGSDGHTASFFPGAKTLSKALDQSSKLRCCAVEPPAAPHQRMTLTLPFLLKAENVYLHVVGEEKREVLETAMQHGEVEELPIRAFLHQPKCSLEIHAAEV